MCANKRPCRPVKLSPTCWRVNRRDKRRICANHIAPPNDVTSALYAAENRVCFRESDCQPSRAANVQIDSRNDSYFRGTLPPPCREFRLRAKLRIRTSDKRRLATCYARVLYIQRRNIKLSSPPHRKQPVRLWSHLLWRESPSIKFSAVFMRFGRACYEL